MTDSADQVMQGVSWLLDDPTSRVEVVKAIAAAWPDCFDGQAGSVEVRLGGIHYVPNRVAHIAATVAISSHDVHGNEIIVHIDLAVLPSANIISDYIDDLSSTNAEGIAAFPPFKFKGRNIVCSVVMTGQRLGEIGDMVAPARFRSMALPALPLRPGAVSHVADVARHLPGRRVIMSWNGSGSGSQFVVDLNDCPLAAQAAINLRQISAWAEQGHFSFRVPHYVHYNPALRTLITRRMSGISLTEFIPVLRQSHLRMIGEALASLHASAACSGDIRTVASVWRGVWACGRELASALPEVSSRVDELLLRLCARLKETDDGIPVPIHGNLTADHIVIDEREGLPNPVGLIGWEGWCAGNPLADIGHLIAHLIYLAKLGSYGRHAIRDCIGSLLLAYEQSTGKPVRGSALRWHIAASLMTQVRDSSLRQLAPDWQRHVDVILTEANRVLNSAVPDWLPTISSIGKPPLLNIPMAVVSRRYVN